MPAIVPRIRSPKCLAALSILLLFLGGNGAGAKVLYKFQGGSDGANPQSTLIMDGVGNLYGTTHDGGGTQSCGGEAPLPGCGTVFKLARDGTETPLYTFKGGTGDGGLPDAGVMSDASGNLYGTTSDGGGSGCNGVGCGVVFKLSAGGSETILHSFQGGSSDGEFPTASLIMDGRGNLYGTTEGGGPQNAGTVFEITTAGKMKLLYSFCAVAPTCSDGWTPGGNLILKDGNLYGTTAAGGGNSCNCGVVFKLSRNGETESVLHAFQGAPDGFYPSAGVVMDKSGNLYGTTQFGGTICPDQPTYGCGTVFEIAANGTESILHAFQGGSDGALPAANLIIDSTGNLYGTTEKGGTDDDGTIFEIPAGGSETVLYWGGQRVDMYFQAGLLLKGNELYGTTYSGGKRIPKDEYGGIVFELKK